MGCGNGSARQWLADLGLVAGSLIRVDEGPLGIHRDLIELVLNVYKLLQAIHRGVDCQDVAAMAMLIP